MSFSVPSAILLALLALPIIAFYILKVRMRRIPVSTNLFWKQIFEEKPPRSIWQNFRHLISLLVQLFLLASLILALADPYLPWQILQARRIVLVIDPSASMQATDIVPSRFVAAKEAAKSIVEGLRFRDEVAIVRSGGTPEVVIGMTSHAPTLMRAIEDVRVTDNGTSLDSAIELGKQLIGSHPHGQVIVLTDACDSNRGLESANAIDEPKVESKIDQVDVQYRVFATEAANVGIHQFQVRRSLIDPIGYEILVGAFNASSNPLKCRLELSLNEAVVDVIPLELKANEKWSRAIEKTSMKGGTLHAQLTRIASSDAEKIPATSAAGPSKEQTSKSNAESSKSNAATKEDSKDSLNLLNRDDDAWAILPAREVQKVLIVTSGNVFLTKVFEANPLVEVSIAKELPLQFPSDTLIVLHQSVPERLPSGNVFVVDPTTSCDLWDVGGEVENPIVTEIDKTSTLMHHVRLDNVLMSKANQLQFKSNAKTLAGTIDKFPVYAEVLRPESKCLVLSVNLDESDLAFRTVFPIIVSNALGWFAGKSGELVESKLTGAAINVAIPKATVQSGPLDRLVLRSPSGIERLMPPPSRAGAAIADSLKISDAAERLVGTGPMSEVGIWRMEAAPSEKTISKVDGGKAGEGQAGEGKVGDAKNGALEKLVTEIAVNLTDPFETDLRPDSKYLASDKGSLLAASWLSRPLWFYLVALACCIVTAEWFLYQRRIIT